MKLAVVGGKLQGTEAAYLAQEAGFDVVLIDRRPGRPASGLVSETHVFDVTTDVVRAREVLTGCDAVLPTCEDMATLACLARMAPTWGVPLLFDLESYKVSSSKLASNDLFARLDVPRPQAWPACGFPAIVKPSVGSGSQGVRLARSEPELALLRAGLAAEGGGAVVEEYVPGPSLSLEVVAWGDETTVLLTTDLEFDAAYDCKRVNAPVEPAGVVTAATIERFREVTGVLARGIGLHGVMDVEVMVAADGTPKVLEIDARLPSQTPACVFHASDVNLLALVVDTYLGASPPAVTAQAARGAVYEHVLARDGVVEVLGEHMIGGAGPLTRRDGLWGADVVLTDHETGAREWRAILMTRGADLPEARARADEAVARLATDEGLTLAPEGEPSMAGV
jgi:pyrrolysine biosynthesis protein PylC